MRKLEDWMGLTQEEIDRLPDESWEHYKNGWCICHAGNRSECCCGAWWRN